MKILFAARRLGLPAMFSLGFILLMVLTALAAPLLPIQDPNLPDLLLRSAPPAWIEGGSMAHPFGTDMIGRDVLARIIHGGRTSLSIGLGVTLVACLLGVTLGMLSGYFGGAIDAAISFVITARLSLPVVLVCLAAVAVFGTSFMVITIVLGCLLWDRFALVSRARAQQLRLADYVTAVKLQGASTPRVLLTEVLPGLLPQIMVIGTLEIGLAIVLETALSFLGMGVPPPTPSWGLMIAEGRADILFNPWLVVLPSIALFLVIMSINIVGDALQANGPEGQR